MDDFADTLMAEAKWTLHITTANTYTAVCAGDFRELQTFDNGKGRKEGISTIDRNSSLYFTPLLTILFFVSPGTRCFTFSQESPMPPYAIGFAVGPFQVHVETAAPGHATYYLPEKDIFRRVKNTVQHLGGAIEFLDTFVTAVSVESLLGKRLHRQVFVHRRDEEELEASGYYDAAPGSVGGIGYPFSINTVAEDMAYCLHKEGAFPGTELLEPPTVNQAASHKAVANATRGTYAGLVILNSSLLHSRDLLDDTVVARKCQVMAYYVSIFGQLIRSRLVTDRWIVVGFA